MNSYKNNILSLKWRLLIDKFLALIIGAACNRGVNKKGFQCYSSQNLVYFTLIPKAFGPKADIVSEQKVWRKILFHITVNSIIFDLARNYQKSLSKYHLFFT